MRNAEFILCTSFPKVAQTQNFRTKGTWSILISQKRNLRLRSTDVLQVVQWHNARSGWSWDMKQDLNAANHAFGLDSALALVNIMPGIACFFMIFFLPLSSTYLVCGPHLLPLHPHFLILYGHWLKVTGLIEDWGTCWGDNPGNLMWGFRDKNLSCIQWTEIWSEMARVTPSPVGIWKVENTPNLPGDLSQGVFDQGVSSVTWLLPSPIKKTREDKNKQRLSKLQRDLLVWKAPSPPDAKIKNGFWVSI